MVDLDVVGEGLGAGYEVHEQTVLVGEIDLFGDVVFEHVGRDAALHETHDVLLVFVLIVPALLPPLLGHLSPHHLRQHRRHRPISIPSLLLTRLIRLIQLRVIERIYLFLFDRGFLLCIFH